MRNLTLAIEDGLLAEARKVAVQRGTTVNRLVREYLDKLVHQEGCRVEARARLKEAMEKGIAEVGELPWSREDLYER